MTALIVNILTAILGALAASGVKLNLSPETIAQLAGALVTVVAIVNQLIHSARDKDAKDSKQGGFASPMLLLLLAAAALIAGLLGGCASPAVDPAGLAAVTKENNASVGCATGTGPWGRAGVVYVNAEHASIASGKVTVNTDCSVTMEANQPAPAK